MKKVNAAPTMKDVAKEAGVALGTVSKVVNGLPVGDSYRIRVERAIKKLDYQINSYAQGLKVKKSRVVAFLLPNMQEPFYASLAYHVNNVLLKRNYRMQLCTTDFDSEKEREYIVMARQGQADGIIGFACNPELMMEEDIPFVSIDCRMGGDIPCVTSDNFGGGQLAAGKLADLGCRNVAFLCAGSPLGSEPDKRKAGFENICGLRGITCETKILGKGESYEAFGDFLAERISNGKLIFDGIFCMTDGLAYFIMKLLQKMNQRIPEDVQIIGFDGVQPFGGGSYLCSTIVQPAPEIAETCVALLLKEEAVMKSLLICLPVTYGYGGTTRESMDRLRI